MIYFVADEYRFCSHRRNARKGWGALILSASLAACGGGDAGTEEGTESTSGLLPDGEQVFDVEGGTLEVTAMSVLVAEIVFEAEGPQSIAMSEPGPFDIDILAATSQPQYPLVDLEAGTWTGNYLGVEITDSVPGRAGIELEATFHTETEATPVLFVFNSAETFEPAFPEPFVLEEPLTLDPGRIFHPSLWFPTIDLREAERRGDGVIELSSTSNVSLFNEVADALDLSTQTVTVEDFL